MNPGIQTFLAIFWFLLEVLKPQKWQTFESLLQINKDGIRNNAYLEREIAETLCRKHSIDLQGNNIIMSSW